MSEIKLLPCPFCGGEAILHHNGLTEKDHVTCLDCCCRTKDSITREEAIKHWNTRKSMERIIERLEEERKQYSRRSEEWRKQKVWLEEQRHYSKACSYNHAIDIVKEEGGIE